MGGLEQIKDRRSADNIEAITNCFINRLAPLRVYLFGSFAEGTYHAKSDYDFYIVVSNETDTQDTCNRARKLIRGIQNRPVDIVVGTNARFEKYGYSDDTLFIEGEVFKKGKLLYDQKRDYNIQRTTSMTGRRR